MLLCIVLNNAAPAHAQTESERFDIESFVVEGNTLLKPQEIEALLKPFSGTKREYGDVQRALEALEVRYRERGYSAVQVFVPEQELGGRVKLQVIEPSIRRVVVEGGRFYSRSNVRAALPAVKEGMFPNAVAISENVQLANENPSRKLDVVLKGAEEEGLVDVEVKVDDSSPHKFTLSMDNTGNASTGQYRTGVSYQHGNLFDRDHMMTASYQTSPSKPSQVSIYSVSYRLPLYKLGDSIDAIIAKSDVDAGQSATVAGPLAFSGKGDIYGLRYNWLLPRRGEYAHRMVFGFDQREFRNSCTIGGVAVIGGAPACGPAGLDVTVRPLSFAYSGNWARPGAQSDINVSFNRNWPGANRGNASDIAAARPSPTGGPGAIAGYSIFRAGASHFQAFASDWQARAAVSLQYTSQALVSGEQFGIAGSTAVRGFSEREIARDMGHFTNLELYTPNFGPKIGFGGANVRLVTYYDFGSASNNPLQGETRQNASISSVGVGLRWQYERSFNWRLDFSQVTDEAGGKLPNARRAQFALNYTF